MYAIVITLTIVFAFILFQSRRRLGRLFFHLFSAWFEATAKDYVLTHITQWADKDYFMYRLISVMQISDFESALSILANQPGYSAAAWLFKQCPHCEGTGCRRCRRIGAIVNPTLVQLGITPDFNGFADSEVIDGYREADKRLLAVSNRRAIQKR